MGWGKETQARWPPSVTMIKPRQRPLMHTLPYPMQMLEPGMVVVRRFLPSLLPRCEHSFWGASSTQFPLDQLHLHRLLSFLDTKVILPWEEKEMGLKVSLHFQEAPLQSSESPPLQPNFTVGPFISPLSQIEGGSGFHPALNLLQDVNQARGQLECELA